MSRLVWSQQRQGYDFKQGWETIGLPDRCVFDGRPSNGDVCGHCRHAGHYTDDPTGHVRGLYRIGLRIGPRLRLPQAKDVPEAVIMRVLGSKPGERWTAWKLFDHTHSLPVAAPELAAFPWKVLNAKLASMRRRELIDGCPCGCRGDWRL